MAKHPQDIHWMVKIKKLKPGTVLTVKGHTDPDKQAGVLADGGVLFNNDEMSCNTWAKHVYGRECSIYEVVLLPNGNPLKSLRTVPEEGNVYDGTSEVRQKEKFLVRQISLLVEEHGEDMVRKAVNAVFAPKR